MLVQSRFVIVVLAILMALGLVLAACATQPAPTAAPTQAPAAAPAKAAPTTAAAPAKAEPAAVPTKAAAAPAAPAKPAAAPAAPKPAGPQVGGTLVQAVTAIGTSLDPQDLAVSQNSPVINMMGTGLVTKDLITGEPIPYLAERWKVSDDGLTYEFKLKKYVKWHDGAPLTAKDYVYTLERATAKKTPWTANFFGKVTAQQAPDDQTLVLKLAEPDASFLSSLALYVAFSQPVPKNAIDKLGEKFATQPVLSGPYKFKEMHTGLKIVLERNLDFNWGPSWLPGPPHIQNVEFRVVKEYATTLGGLESERLTSPTFKPRMSNGSKPRVG